MTGLRQQLTDAQLTHGIFGFGGYSQTQTRRKLVASIREPALAIWQATKCLAKIQARTEAPEVSRILAEAESTLLGLMLTLIRRTDNVGPLAPGTLTSVRPVLRLLSNPPVA